MIVGADGSERGPFKIAELRWMWRRNQIDEGTTLRAEGADVTTVGKAMAAELDSPGEEIEVLTPTLESEPPELPGRCGGPALPKTFCGLSDWQWIGVAGVVIVLGLGVMHWTGTFERIQAEKAARAQFEKRREAESAERLAVEEKARQLAKADAVELANKGVKPTRTELRKLAASRARLAKIPETDNAMTAWHLTYEWTFKSAYKSELNW